MKSIRTHTLNFTLYNNHNPNPLVINLFQMADILDDWNIHKNTSNLLEKKLCLMKFNVIQTTFKPHGQYVVKLQLPQNYTWHFGTIAALNKSVTVAAAHTHAWQIMDRFSAEQNWNNGRIRSLGYWRAVCSLQREGKQNQTKHYK